MTMTRLAVALLGLCALAFPLYGQGASPDQPFASFWFPEDLLTWSPATDPDAPFNRSHVALAPRSADAVTQVNSHARTWAARPTTPISSHASSAGVAR